MVARKLSSYDIASSPESFSKRPSVYIDPDSDIFEGLQYLQNIDRQNCINCLQLWRTSSAALEGILDDCLHSSVDTSSSRRVLSPDSPNLQF